MAKTLKIGFAMGGGVSLGSFSGGGLSEVIKQAVLNAGYYEEINGQRTFTKYENVVIDVFSGASAGSMSLAIMLRGLVHQTQEEESEAMAQLHNEGYTEANVGARWKDLVVAQVVQQLQKKIWVDEINLDGLLGSTGKEKAALTCEGGILRRGALERIAYNYFQMDDAYAGNFNKKRILANEVLFASTLSNLTGIVYRGDDQGPKDPNYAGSHDADTSEEHKELRVFHLLFDIQDTGTIKADPEGYPAGWLRYHTGPKTTNVIGDLRSRSAWARIVTTSLACGAFPFAFEPVPLERFQFEYGPGCWPPELTPEICALAMGNDSPQPPGEVSFPFCYVDGGTFNNEPVREAFRMAAFLDSEDETDFDRVIVFIDPDVNIDATDFRMPFAQQFSVHEPRKFLGSLEGYHVVQRGTLDRLLPHIATMVNMLTEEGKVKESNKIKQVADLFNKKEEYYQIFEKLGANLRDVTATVEDVLRVLNKIFKEERLNDIVPVGTLTVKGELIRVTKGPQSKFGALRQHVDGFCTHGINAVPTGLQHQMLMALLTIFMDFLMDLSGKSPANKMIAIAPVEKKGGKYQAIELPGRRLAAFSGFASKPANEYAVNLAIYCARELMCGLGMLPENFALGARPDWTKKDDEDFHTAFKSKLAEINDRIDSIFEHSHFVDIFPGVNNVILHQLSKMIGAALAKMEWEKTGRQSFRFMIEVGDKNLDINANESFSAAHPFQVGSQVFLITELYYYPGTYDGFYWNGVHAQQDKLVIKRDSGSIMPDRGFCTIYLPSRQEVGKAALMPNPTFVYRMLTANDKGADLPAGAWKITSGVRLVEQTLLG